MTDECTDYAIFSFMGEETCQANVRLSDSGCNRHITCSREYFATYEEFPHAKAVKMGNNSSLPTYSKGIIYVKMFLKEDCILGFLEDVWYVPDFFVTIFSVGACLNKGYTQTTDAKKNYLHEKWAYHG